MNFKRPFSFIISIFVFICFTASAPPIEDSFVREVVDIINHWSRLPGREIDGFDYSKKDLVDIVLPKKGGYMEISDIRKKRCFAETYYSGYEVGVVLDAYNSRVVIFLERDELACVRIVFKDFGGTVIKYISSRNSSGGIARWLIIAVMGLRLDALNAAKTFEDILNNQEKICSKLNCVVSPTVKENLFKDPLNARYLANELDID